METAKSSVATVPVSVVSGSLGEGELAPSRSLSLSLPLLLQEEEEEEVSEVAEPGEDESDVEEANLAVGEGGEPATEVPFLNRRGRKGKEISLFNLDSFFP